VDSAIYATASQQGGIGRIHNSINLERGEIGFNDLDSPVSLCHSHLLLSLIVSQSLSKKSVA
jgi:hypothetical protein